MSCPYNGFKRMSADGQQAANVTNLALKGIIGIRAMADMSNALGKSEDAKRYLVGTRFRLSLESIL